MNQVFKNVKPIAPGFDNEIRIQYSDQYWTLMAVGTGRLIAHFREEVDSESILFTADTDNGSITRSAGNTLSIKIPASATVNWKMRGVVFDIARVDGSEKSGLPGAFRWPVRQRVTRDV